MSILKWSTEESVMNEAVCEILGIRGKIANRLELAENIENGLPARSIERIKQALAIGDVQVSNALGISVKTMGRIRKEKRRLSSQVGDRLYRIAHILALAKEVLEDDEMARIWLNTPQIALNNRVPLDFMNTGAGTREVEDLLLRIEYGVIS